jgi:hypothetical protein
MLITELRMTLGTGTYCNVPVDVRRFTVSIFFRDAQIPNFTCRISGRILEIAGYPAGHPVDCKKLCIQIFPNNDDS